MQRMLVMKQYNMLFVCEMLVIDTITSLWRWNLILRDKDQPQVQHKTQAPTCNSNFGHHVWGPNGPHSRT
jgi:hypothetical protein